MIIPLIDSVQLIFGVSRARRNLNFSQGCEEVLFIAILVVVVPVEFVLPHFESITLSVRVGSVRGISRIIVGENGLACPKLRIGVSRTRGVGVSDMPFDISDLLGSMRKRVSLQWGA